MGPGKLLSVAVARADGKALVTVGGELDTYTAGSLRDALASLVDEPAGVEIVLDVRDVSFVDSTGLGVIATVAKKRRDRGGDLIVSGPTDGLYRVLEIAGLDKALTVTRI